MLFLHMFFFSSDKGTLYANANVVNNLNGKKDAVSSYSAVKEFFNLHLDSYIIAASMKYFDMKSMDDVVLPQHIVDQPTYIQRERLHEKVADIIDKFVMLGKDLPVSQLQCRFQDCHESFTLSSAQIRHEEVFHGFVHGETQPSSGDEDHIFNYGCTTLQLGLLLRNADDSVKEGDGARIFRIWKFLMPLYKQHKHNKYALAALHLQASVYSLLDAELAHELLWNRTVNYVGGKGEKNSKGPSSRTSE